MGDERRRFPRLPFVLSVTADGGADGALQLSTVNVSLAGALLVGPVAWAMDEHVTLKVGFPGFLEEHAVEAIVRWVQPAAGDVDPSFGIEWDPDAADLLLRRALEAAANETGLKGRLRVLVADDSRLMRELLGDGVKELTEDADDKAADVVHAVDGQQAWEALEKGGFDLAILDVNMPVLTGLEVLSRVRETAALQTLPVVMVSADRTTARQEALDGGADLFLPKPVRLMDLLETVQALVHARH
jgi:CheY-like chemotaxis protein